MENETRERASAVIIKDNKILLMKRVKPNLEYFVFPGGGVEKNESLDDTLKREVKEELSLDIKKWRLLFNLENQFKDSYNNMHLGNQKEYYFTIEEFTGTPELGGPEKEKMNEQNQYYLEWIDLTKIGKMENLYPKEAVINLLNSLGQ
ncbi:MAG: NUDIX domain-containing protein [Patescibacteria group bacterium]